MYKVPVVIKDEYIIFFEPSVYGVLIHCEVMKWNVGIAKRLITDFATLRELHGYNHIYALHDDNTQDNKHIKFLRKMGFTLRGVLKDGRQVWQIDGEEYE